MRVGLRNFVAGLGVAALGVAALPSSARAATIIEFDDAHISGGTVIQSGTTITGTDILFDIITLSDDITNVVYAEAQCGSGSVAESPTNVCVMNFTFDTVTSTGTISITTLGGLYGVGADGIDFSGDESGTQFLAPGSSVLTGTLSAAGFATTTTFGATGTDTKNQALLDFFNIVVVGDFALSTTEIRVADTGNVTDADLTNGGEILLVPEPGMLGLFGLGLLGVGSRLRRRKVN